MSFLQRIWYNFLPLLWMLPLVAMISCTMLPEPHITIVAGDNDNNSTVHVSKGDMLSVRLASNPTTGYMWHIVVQDTVQLSLLKEESELAGGKVVGGGGYQVWHFKAINLGSSSLELHYKRSWEKDQAPAKTYHITVEIK